jgi:hypothetical protein
MILKSQTKKEDERVIKLKELLESLLKMKIYAIPAELNWIAIVEEGEERFVIQFYNKEDEIIGEISGMKTLKECKDYTRVIVKEARLSEDDDVDIYYDYSLSKKRL